MVKLDKSEGKTNSVGRGLGDELDIFYYNIPTEPAIALEYMEIMGISEYSIVDFHYTVNAFINSIKSLLYSNEIKPKLEPRVRQYLYGYGTRLSRFADYNTVNSCCLCSESEGNVSKEEVQYYNEKYENSKQRLNMSKDELLVKYFYREEHIKELKDKVFNTLPCDLLTDGIKENLTIQDVITFYGRTATTVEERRFMAHVTYFLAWEYSSEDVHLIKDETIGEVLRPQIDRGYFGDRPMSDIII